MPPPPKGTPEYDNWRRRISESLTNKPHPHKGSPQSEEHKKKRSNSMLGNKNSSGFKHTEETKQKWSDARKGKKKPPRSEEHCKHLSESKIGKPTWNKGKTGIYSDETIKKLSDACLEAGSPTWKGGISQPYYQRLRRENNPDICEHCRTTEGLIDTHHKDLNHFNNNIDNLMVLCRSCHMKLHSSLRNHGCIQKAEV